MSGRSQPPARWFRRFPAAADQVGEARQFVAACLGGTPQTGDALLCVPELAANAVQHSRSGRPGGHFRVRVSRFPGLLRVEVTDEGGQWASRPPGDTHGRGLAIVRALAGGVHISDLDADSPARAVAFEMRIG